MSYSHFIVTTVKMRFTSIIIAALPLIGSVFAAPFTEKDSIAPEAELAKKEVDVLSVVNEVQSRVVGHDVVGSAYLY